MADSLIQSASLESIAAIGTSLLLGSAIKALLLLAAVGAVAWRLRGASAAIRHLLWFCAICGLAVLPLAALILPGWNVLPSWVAMPVGPDPTPVATSIQFEELSRGPAMPNPSTDTLQAGSLSRTVVAPMPHQPIMPAAHEPIRPARDSSWRLVILTVWISGCVVALVPVLAGTVSLLSFSGGRSEPTAVQSTWRLGEWQSGWD